MNKHMIDVNKRNSRVHMFTKIVLQFVKIHIQCMPTLYLYKSKKWVIYNYVLTIKEILDTVSSMRLVEVSRGEWKF